MAAAADDPLEQNIAELRQQLPPMQRHYEGVTEAQVAARRQRQRNYQELLREKLQDRWFAALVSTKPEDLFAIQGRFQTPKGLLDFVVEREALVEVWATPAAGAEPARRIPATDLAAIKQQPREPPLFVTLTYREPAGGEIVKQRVEFGFGAAATALASQQAYQRHRELQSVARAVLGARDAGGSYSARAQWRELHQAVEQGRFTLVEMPQEPFDDRDLFVAFEFEVDESNHFTRAFRLWRESEITKQVVRDASGDYRQILRLKKSGDLRPREATGYRVRGVSDELEPVPAPILGQDFIELRVRDPQEADPRRWNVLEFGEPEIVKQSSLAQFSLISAYLDKQRKEVALKKSKLDLFAEPVFAGLSVGAGLSGMTFPLGEAARLGYNTLVTPWYIPAVPSVKQMRELFRLVTARDQHPVLQRKPASYLDAADFNTLQEKARHLTDAEVADFLHRMTDEDLQAMLRLAKMQRCDARLVNLLSIIADAGKVSGWTDTAGPQREIFNSIYFSVTGEVSIKNIIAVLAGGEVATPLSGVSLYDLSRGEGPAEAWLQFFNFTVDIRAVLNTLARLCHSDLANKELKKPFPYAPRLSDLSAYEIRIFGYPLLIFYKRGLLKDDYAAYQQDYAYGFLGATLVEHFKTRADMDAEIRAGRMMPLGYVRVPDGRGGWKESNLAVFAHRIPSGKHRGKTSVIIYGLKAYTDQSQLIRREFQRFKQFERALEQGAVIEQLVDAENREQLPPTAFEPVVHVGPPAAQEKFTPLLGRLLEWRRHRQRESWGLPSSEEEAKAVAALQRELVVQGIRAEDRAEDPLLGVDRFNSSILYKKFVEGRWQVIKLVSLPSQADVTRELAKAKEAERLEQLRRAAVSETGEGIVLLNTVKEVNGRFELGSLWQDQHGQVIGQGVRVGAEAMEKILTALDQLPVTARARLRFNDYAATLVELDPASDGRVEKVFLTIEFPPAQKLQREWTHPLSGAREVLSFEDGRLRRVVTDQRIVELDYDPNQDERASRTYVNTGTRQQPVPGKLLEETQTLEVWFRDGSQVDPDPYQPLLSKLRFSHVTAESSRDTYGLFPLPVATVDDQYLIQNRFNAYGLLTSASVRDNGNNDQDFQRNLLAKLLQPVPGRERFVLTSQTPPPELAGLHDARTLGYKTTLERKDLVKGLSKIMVFDNARFGRKVGESWEDAFDGAASFAEQVTAEFRDDFFFGLVPWQTTRRSATTGVRLSETRTIGFDPMARRLTAVETDYNGQTRTNIWDYRWEVPIEVETARRRTTNYFDRLETAVVGTTTSRSSGEELTRFAGEYDLPSKTWRALRLNWFRPGLTNRAEIETRSSFGKWIATRTGEAFEARPAYDASGIERTNRITRRNPATGQFDLLHQREDDYQWQQGQRETRIQTYIDGQPYDLFRRVTDSDGRTLLDGVRQFPGLELKTVLAYDGDSDRVLGAEQFQNNSVRVTRQRQTPQRQPDGSWVLPVTVTPRWGLVSTQLFLVGDLLGRPLLTTSENGERVEVREWFPDTSLARVAEVIDRHGRPTQRWVKILNRGTNEAIPFDVTSGFRLSYWGAAALAEEEASVRGTDIALFTDSAEVRTFFNRTKNFKAPWFKIDPHGAYGMTITLGSSAKSNVLAVLDASLHEPPLAERSRQVPELWIHEIDLRGLFFHRVSQQHFDRSGSIREESIGRILNLGDHGYTEESIFQTPVRRLQQFRYYYRRGWFVEQPAQSGGRMLVFTEEPPAPGSRSYSVNEGRLPEALTHIDGLRFVLEDEPGVADVNNFFFRRIHSPRLLERNPHLPDRNDVWLSLITTEKTMDGDNSFDLETIFDAQGRVSVAKADKRTTAGEPATKIAYQLIAPPAGSLKEQTLAAGEQTLSLDALGRQDFSANDFLYFYITGLSNIAMRIADDSGRSVKVRSGDARFASGEVAPWQIHAANVQWLPDRDVPRQGTQLMAPAWLVQAGQVVAVSVHDLARAGLEIRRVRSLQLVASNTAPTRWQVSPVYALARGGPFLREDETREFSFSEQAHSSGLKTSVIAEQDRRERDVYAGQRMSAMIEFNGLPVAAARARSRLARFPHLVWLDNSDFDSPRPLYALSPKDGQFLEHYRVLKLGDGQVYSIVRGFTAPRLEVYRAGVLDDEVYPGFISYGEDYRFGVAAIRGHSTLSKALSSLHQRVEANVFKLAGDQARRVLPAEPAARELSSHVDFNAQQNASAQAERISRLPMLAQTLLPSRDVPWKEKRPFNSVPWSENWDKLRFALDKLHLDYPTGLIPTALETDIERYVDTVQEADLIVLAVKLGDTVLAKELLDFYWRKSHGGQLALHAAYDAYAGTSMKADVMSPRPPHARRTAEAQLAIANAAFYLGLETSDAQWLTLGRNLIDVVLGEFRPPALTNGAPRGIAESQVLPTHHAFGFTLWPDADLYSLRSNARAYLLLKHLSPLIGARFSDPSWSQQIAQAAQEQESFLKAFVLPQVERTGVAPQGVFQIQDISRETTALGVQRWTSAEDWLAWLEAAAAMGLAPETTRRWLENLARVHGVSVNGIWGIDWRVALLRPDAISPDLTAMFLRVADALGHTQAVAFAEQNLAAQRQDGRFPVVLTTAAPRLALAAGEDFTVAPRTDRQGWPRSLTVYKELQERSRPGWNLAKTAPKLATLPPERVWPVERADLTVFVLLTAGFYLSILGSSIFWWAFRSLRRREQAPVEIEAPVPETVMHRAEERWAKRVLGLQTPERAEHWRFSNASVEQNFLMQLRAIYKLVLEWRRLENDWAEDDPRLAEDGTDPWLNGADEFASLVGLYMRCVIKAGAKDGFRQDDRLAENEDSNHIWSRLTLYFSEHLWGLLALVNDFQNVVVGPGREDLRHQIERFLETMGLRRRPESFDGRWLFNFPSNPAAMDLLVLQKPGTTLAQVMVLASFKLGIPYEHIQHVIGQYKQFKQRENPYPIHPHLIEFAKMLPHFLLMGLGAIIWYNQRIGDSPILPYLGSLGAQLGLSLRSLTWALPLLGGLLLNAAAYFLRAYRFKAAIRPRERAEMILDASLTSLFVKGHDVTPEARTGRWWDPTLYEWCGWGLRTIGFAWFGVTLLGLETPSFGTFMIVKGLLAMLAFAEVGGIVLPLTGTILSKFLQDWISRHPDAGALVRFANGLNITATTPASPLWLSIKYHAQPSVPTGSFWSLLQAVVFYFLLAASFFFVGGYLCQQIFSLWFTDTYLNAEDWKLLLGSLGFWNTMYLLRYGLFLLYSGLASAWATFPIKVTCGVIAVAQLLLVLFSPKLGLDPSQFRSLNYAVAALGLGLMFFEHRILAWLRHNRTQRLAVVEAKTAKALEKFKTDPNAALGVVYMSGDALSAEKLTPDLLMSRWTVLRDKLDSEGLRLLAGLARHPDDAALRSWFQALYDAEKKSRVTLWHPVQLGVAAGPAGNNPGTEAGDAAGPQWRLPPEMGLHITAESEAQREQILTAWHLRRWLVCMMSTAGHSQDTGVNLVDIAVRLHREGLSHRSVFYLIQNKYDNNDNNRPTQIAYDQGEAGQRNKLARLLGALAPGTRAYCLQNWTPFGFKAGGLTGMDLVPEASLQLTTLLLLDRDATVHDLDALMLDLRQALTDPDVVIIIPGRSTTNTLTPLGQGSQLVEEGHRSFLKGLMTCLGGGASEAVGTGWGNLLACFYGRVQHALLRPQGRKMPLTTGMRRGTTFADRMEGLIGFGPHAVGISEDIWAVVQTMHNALALGHRVKFALSRAFWHKIRETWSHAEWLASFPRWAGGYLQMLHDPLMQRIYEFGPQPVFAKEVRANSGRTFLSAPLAMLNILCMPLAIMLDVTPFVQILLVLWNFGFVMNQVLTLHALNTYLECSGFYRGPAVVGAVMAGALCAWMPAWQPYAPGLVLLGFGVGGFQVGLSRWLYTRVRDLLLFGPQLVLQTLGQVVRLNLEFVVSGASPEDAKQVNIAFRAWAGPREDRPLERYPHFINLRTVIWAVGLPSLLLSVFALSNLDLLNVLLLLPTLLFSVSALTGPFLLKPSVGRPLGFGVVVPKTLGWLTGLAFYTAVSLLIARGGSLGWIGVGLFSLVFLFVLGRALRYLPFHYRLNRRRKVLMKLLTCTRLKAEEANKLTERILQQCASDASKVQTELERAGVSAEQQTPILQWVTDAICPLLRTPVQESQSGFGAGNRWVSEWSRSAVLSLFVLLWFFIVPVPGLIVFTASDYQLTVGLGKIGQFFGWALGIIIVSAWIGSFIQWIDYGGWRKTGLKSRLEQAYRQLCSLAQAPGPLTPAEVAGAYALFTDAQTFLDQRSYAYARHTLGAIEKMLLASNGRQRT